MAEKNEGVSRRELFHVIGSAPAIGALATGPAAAQSGGQKAAYKRKVFDDRQWRTVRVLCDLIIPADERSGSATQAGVAEFIDDWIDFRKEQTGSDGLLSQILGGLSWLDRESSRLFQKAFADAAVDQQKQILDRIAWPERAAKEDQPWVVFFNQFRDLTVSGFFSSKTGVADIGYIGNTALPDWKGCDPKVWAIIEERMKKGYKGVAGPEVKPWNT